MLSSFFSPRRIQINLQWALSAVFQSFSSSPTKTNSSIGVANFSEIICKPLQFGFLYPATEDET